MAEYWVVAADSGKARIFSRNKKFSVLEEIETLVHPESRLHRQDLTSDRPGQVQESRTPGESINEETTDPKVHEAQVFARELAARIREARVGGQFRQLVIVADPKFLGHLRKAMDSETAKLVAGEVASNVTRENLEAITRAADSALQ